MPRRGGLNKIDLTGKTFGLLTVLKEEDQTHLARQPVGEQRNSGPAGRRRKASWVCRCECGKFAHVLGTYLRTGEVRSCGCLLSAESRSERSSVDLTGNIYGRLTAVSRASAPGDSRTMWICTCSCGNSKEFRANSLVRGETKSCGCLVREVSAATARARNSARTIDSRMRQEFPALAEAMRS